MYQRLMLLQELSKYAINDLIELILHTKMNSPNLFRARSNTLIDKYKQELIENKLKAEQEVRLLASSHYDNEMADVPVQVLMK